MIFSHTPRECQEQERGVEAQEVLQWTCSKHVQNSSVFIEHSSSTFMMEAFTLKVYDSCQIKFCVWDEVIFECFFIHMKCLFPRRLSSYICSTLHPYIIEGLFLGSFFCSRDLYIYPMSQILHSFYYFSLIIGLEVVHALYFALLFQHCLRYSRPFSFPKTF